MLTLTRQFSASPTEQELAEGPTEHPCVLRIWDLTTGDTFRGRTVTAIHGVVGLAYHPVAVIYFSGTDHPARICATHSETLQHSGGITLRARDWIRNRGLSEGDPVDLATLRSEVLTTALN